MTHHHSQEETDAINKPRISYVKEIVGISFKGDLQPLSPFVKTLEEYGSFNKVTRMLSGKQKSQETTGLPELEKK